MGHLLEDCTASVGVAAPTPDNPNAIETPTSSLSRKEGDIYTPELKRLYLTYTELYAMNSLTRVDFINAKKLLHIRAISVENAVLGLILPIA